MSTASRIEWTETTWNPTTGCDRISPGCDNCYALTLAKRLKAMGSAKYQTDGNPVTSGPGFGVAVHHDALTEPYGWRRPRLVFVNSMSDLFHARVPEEFIARVWQVMGCTPQHTYQVLTKRPNRMRSFLDRWYSGEIAEPYDVRTIPGYPGYSVSTQGEVLGKRMDTRGGLTPEAGEQGHLRVTLYQQGTPKRELVHRLVLTTFVRTPRPGEQACHRNGNPRDNRLSNLYWGTQQDNWRDRIAHGNGRSYAKLTADQVDEVRRRHSAGESAYGIAKDFPVSDTQIRNILTGRQWSGSADLPSVRQASRAVLDSVWIGTSIESAEYLRRADDLRETPAAVRFLSLEPLLGPLPALNLGGIHWVIVGGESGPRARPLDLGWVREIRDQCIADGARFFFKQVGGRTPKANGRLLDGRTWDEMPDRAVA